MPRHFHDDDFDDRHYEEERTSARPYIILILGIVALVGLGGAAAVGLFFFRFQAVQQERDVAAAQANAAVQFGAAVTDVADAAPDPFPMPNPPASEEFPTDLGAEREPERQGNWTILFRSDDPGYWDTPGNAGNYAIPVYRAPAGVRYLR